MNTLFAFDCDGVLRDESRSYQRCIIETVAFFAKGVQATEKELLESMKQSNDDWERTHKILQQRGVSVDFDEVKEHFQDLYLGPKRNFTGYINDEPWLVDNDLLARLAGRHPMAIVSGAPRNEVRYTLKRNKAEDYFDMIWGMNQCSGKKDGLEKAIANFRPDKIYFCDDRPSPIVQAKLVQHRGMHVYGIIPPQAPDLWHQELLRSGAEMVFKDVNYYCKFLINSNL